MGIGYGRVKDGRKATDCLEIGGVKEGWVGYREVREWMGVR